MNIVIVNPDRSYYFRPDTTLNREVVDYYCPEDAGCLKLTPCIFTKVIKTAKSVNRKFIERYCDSFAFGVILDDNTAAPGIGTSMDWTTLFPAELTSLDEIGGALFSLEINGENVFNQSGGDEEILYNAVIKVTEKSSLRFGDIVAAIAGESFEIKIGDSVSFNGRSFRIL